jgi:hypothetical protein
LRQMDGQSLDYRGLADSGRADEEHRSMRGYRLYNRGKQLVTKRGGTELAGLTGQFPPFEKGIVIFRRGHGLHVLSASASRAWLQPPLLNVPEIGDFYDEGALGTMSTGG